MNWPEINAKILAALDVESEFGSLGVRFPPNRRSTATGWLPCHAMGRDDKSPSAAVNVGDGPLRGRYVDRGGDGLSLGFFDFAARFGPHKDWKESRKHYGKVTKVAGSFPKTEEERGVDKVDLLSSMAPARFDLVVAGMVKAYPGITAEAVRLCGGIIGTYPAKSPTPRYVVAFPVYGPHLFDGGLQGYVIQATDGGKIQLFRGEGNKPEPVKRLTLGSTGLMGDLGLKNLETAEVVWKTAGVSDMLALQALIPVAERDKHAVVTNAGGETEVHLLKEVAHLFAGKRVIVIGDADEPGQTGAKAWCGALKGIASEAGSLKLPFPVTEKHGADLRDWISNGS